MMGIVEDADVIGTFQVKFVYQFQSLLTSAKGCGFSAEIEIVLETRLREPRAGWVASEILQEEGSDKRESTATETEIFPSNWSFCALGKLFICRSTCNASPFVVNTHVATRVTGRWERV